MLLSNNSEKVIKFISYFDDLTELKKLRLCSFCGHQNKEVKELSIRSWSCINCNMEHDRDINAAENILHEGLNILFA